MSANEPDAAAAPADLAPAPAPETAPETAPVLVEEPVPPEPADWRKQETLGSALAQIALAAVLLAAGVAWVHHRATVRNADAEQIQAARELARSDAPPDLLAALSALQPAAGRGVGGALALSARLHADLWLTHGLREHEAPAREQLALAERARSESEDLYATRARALLAEGAAGPAEALCRDVERRGGQGPWLSWALGRSLQARGDAAGAAAAYRRAVEAGWKEPAVLASSGEGLLELGRSEEAARAFQGALARESGHVRALAGLALAKLFAGGAPTLAEKAVQAALAKEATFTPGERARVLAAAAELGRQGTTLGRDARRDAEAAVAAQPENGLAAQVLARVRGGRNP